MSGDIQNVSTNPIKRLNELMLLTSKVWYSFFLYAKGLHYKTPHWALMNMGTVFYFHYTFFIYRELILKFYVKWIWNWAPWRSWRSRDRLKEVWFDIFMGFVDYKKKYRIMPALSFKRKRMCTCFSNLQTSHNVEDFGVKKVTPVP